MRNVLFIHGAGEQADGGGALPRALRAGLGPDVPLTAPIMPNPGAPDAAAWEAALSDLLGDQQPPLVLVGHSLGASLILKYLADHAKPPGLAGVICIAAPFWGLPEWEFEQWQLPPGFEARLSGLPRIVLYHSRDDEEVPVSHLDCYAQALPQALVRKVDGRGHMFGHGNSADIVGDILAAFDC